MQHRSAHRHQGSDLGPPVDVEPCTMPLMGRARITGIGGWLPERVVDNQYFVDYLDTSDDSRSPCAN
jgi:hypothetical protein